MEAIKHIVSKESSRQILAEDFKSSGGELPIQGGWGYSQEDACIIDKNDPLVDPSVPFNGVGVEYVFVEKRIYEEMIIFRPDGEKFSDIKWNLQQQSIVHEGERVFDKLVFEIAAFPDKEWEELKAEYEGPQGYGHPEFDGEAHERKRQEKMVRLTREFWFDITSFYGQGVVVTDQTTGKKKLLQPESFKLTNKFKKLFGMKSKWNPVIMDGRNSNLIDSKKNIFSVLGLVALKIIGPFHWVCEDIEEETATGSIFRAYSIDAKSGLEVASIFVADATHDPTEPDVSILKQSDIPHYVDIFCEDMRKQLAVDGRQMIKWISCQLKQTDRLNSLVMAYIIRDQGRDYQVTALRIKAMGHKVVVIGSFDIAKKDVLEELISEIMGSIVVF